MKQALGEQPTQFMKYLCMDVEMEQMKSHRRSSVVYRADDSGLVSSDGEGGKPDSIMAHSKEESLQSEKENVSTLSNVYLRNNLF